MSQQVLVLSPWVSRQGGGLQSAVRDLVRACNARNEIRHSVIATRDDNCEEDLRAWPQPQPELYPYFGPNSFRLSPSMLRASMRQSWDCLHLHGVWMFPSAVARIHYALRGTPLVISPHGMLDPWIVARSRVKKSLVEWLWEKANWKHARAFRALNFAEAIAIRTLVPNAQIAVIGNGVELPQLDTPAPDTSLRGDFAPMCGPGDKAPPLKLLYLGRLHEKKGLHHLLAAWSRIAAALPELTVKLQVCGWGDVKYEERCRAQAAALNLRHPIEFLGPVFGAEKDSVLRGCDCLILPSVSEGLPVAILEAWSYAKPTLMTDACNLPVGFEKRCAHRITLEPQGLCDAVVRFARTHPTERTEQGKRARALVSDQFSWATIASQMNELTRWSTGKGPRPDFLLSN